MVICDEAPESLIRRTVDEEMRETIHARLDRIGSSPARYRYGPPPSGRPLVSRHNKSGHGFPQVRVGVLKGSIRFHLRQ